MGKETGDKPKSTNSMSQHSKELRRRTSKEWTKQNIISKAIKINKNNPKDMDLYARFESIDASSNKERLRILVDYYFANNENNAWQIGDYRL